jgi:serine O-acetyltransferase
MEANFITQLAITRSTNLLDFPAKDQATSWLEDVFDFLFGGKRVSEAELKLLGQQLFRRLTELLSSLDEAEKHSSKFFEQLPSVYQSLLEDANAILNSDPAAKNLSEVLIAYPGFFSTVVYRISHQLWLQELRILPRLLSEYAHSKTGIDIHPGATIGHGFAIDHGTGIVIGETSVVGNNVKIYQGVTLGALNVDKAHAEIKRHPTIEDDVVIYSNATILGGKTVVGKGSIIGGNVWLTQSVPPDSIVYHTSEIKIKDKNPFAEPLNFII